MTDVITNVADRDQVRAATRRQRAELRRQRKDMVKLLELPEARRYLWSLMADCKVFGSVWAPDEQIRYNSGQQDVGHRILADITEASPDALLLMMRENKPETETTGDENASKDE